MEKKLTVTWEYVKFEKISGTRMGGKILGTPVILTLICLISIIFLKVEVINLW